MKTLERDNDGGSPVTFDVDGMPIIVGEAGARVT